MAVIGTRNAETSRELMLYSVEKVAIRPFWKSKKMAGGPDSYRATPQGTLCEQKNRNMQILNAP